MMKSYAMSLVIVISFLLIAGCSCGRLLAKTSPFIAPDSSSGFDPENTKLSFRVSTSVEMKKKFEFSASNKADDELEFPPNDAETKSGPRSNTISLMTERRLSTSSNGPGVGHMKMFRPKSRHIIESHRSDADGHLQQNESIKGKQSSNPIPGDGN